MYSRWSSDLSLCQRLERLIGHDERDARFSVPGSCAFVNFGPVLCVDCPDCFDTFLILDLEFEDRIGLEAGRFQRECAGNITARRESGDVDKGGGGEPSSVDPSSLHY